MTRMYVVDVSSFNPSSMASYHSAGAKRVIVKGTEGTWYRNPVAKAQIKSAHAHKMYVDMYHFANFSSSSYRAKQEARYAIKQAKNLNISHSRYIWLDWEAESYNYVQGNRKSNTDAIMAFMKTIKKAGYRVGLYSGASLLRNNIDTARVIKSHGTCLWVASYATMGRIDAPNFGYFPSMNGVALWQFTDNWRGLGVDASISLIDLNHSSKSKIQAKPAPKKPAKPKVVSEVYAPVINNNPTWNIALRDKNGKLTGKYIRTNTSWKVWDTKTLKGRKCYKIGNDQQWVPAQYVKVTKYK